MQIRTILYQYIKTLTKHVFVLDFTYELLISFRIIHKTITISDTSIISLCTWHSERRLLFSCHIPFIGKIVVRS